MLRTGCSSPDHHRRSRCSSSSSSSKRSSCRLSSNNKCFSCSSSSSSSKNISSSSSCFKRSTTLSSSSSSNNNNLQHSTSWRSNSCCSCSNTSKRSNINCNRRNSSSRHSCNRTRQIPLLKARTRVVAPLGSSTTCRLGTTPRRNASPERFLRPTQYSGLRCRFFDKSTESAAILYQRSRRIASLLALPSNPMSSLKMSFLWHIDIPYPYRISTWCMLQFSALKGWCQFAF